MQVIKAIASTLVLELSTMIINHIKMSCLKQITVLEYFSIFIEPFMCQDTAIRLISYLLYSMLQDSPKRISC